MNNKIDNATPLNSSIQTFTQDLSITAQKLNDQTQNQIIIKNEENRQIDGEITLRNSSFKKNRKKKYQVISLESRKQFIQKVLSKELTIKRAAKECNIIFSTAKAILHSFKHEGRIGKKKTRARKQNKSSSEQSISELESIKDVPDKMLHFNDQPLLQAQVQPIQQNLQIPLQQNIGIDTLIQNLILEQILQKQQQQYQYQLFQHQIRQNNLITSQLIEQNKNYYLLQNFQLNPNGTFLPQLYQNQLQMINK